VGLQGLFAADISAERSNLVLHKLCHSAFRATATHVAAIHHVSAPTASIEHRRPSKSNSKVRSNQSN